ncbi:MAG TPA: pyridoxal-dependent decarboxylase [Acidisoma sp.]|uniref:pyridoxal phosphate-dependent decarboxylase family protein n=1 Tax=Acidisoma sp. TaxID=1872115 RepID=UPI002C917563|nr:pyridoxal-dependent decarboxylase [Acidisoma sp.]HTI00451.1 pyridoxal-dependent decarboxylase [Acidisoma sp.]
MADQIRPMSGLFCADGDYVRYEDLLTEILREARQRVCEGRVAPVLSASVFRDRLSTYDFVEPKPLQSTIEWVVNQLEQGVVQVTNPRYFGLFNPAPCLPAELAERIVAAFNPQLATATTSPAAIEIERHVIRAFAERAGLPAEAGGHFASGGSEANFTALLCAMAQADPAFVDKGILAFDGPPTFYVSDDAHRAWLKIAVQCGLGHGAVRLVPTDDEGRLNPEVLGVMLEHDKQKNLVPVMIAATAGTTGAGIIDPLHACADLARQHGLWFHVDAAWGGGLLVSNKMRGLLAGIEHSDSVTIDAHKWLATTMACSLFITRHPLVLKRAFFVDSSYMPPSDQSTDPHTTTLQWSRRFLGLRLFLSLATVGWQGYSDHVERSVELADLLAQQLMMRGWVVANRSRLAVVCAIPPQGFPAVAEIAQAVVASGIAWISKTKFKSQDVVRICLTNGRTMPEDVLTLVELLNGFRSADAVRTA